MFTERMDVPVVPRRLPAPAPGWAETTDVVVVGSGIAGLTVALHLRETGLHVTVVTKVNIDDGSTRWAQGGIAAVLDPLDSPEAHAADTITAGVGLCDPAAVALLVREGPARVRELMRWGASFDRYTDGSLMLTREGGHHAKRIVHAGGDATGAEVQRHGETRDPGADDHHVGRLRPARFRSAQAAWQRGQVHSAIQRHRFSVAARGHQGHERCHAA